MEKIEDKTLTQITDTFRSSRWCRRDGGARNLGTHSLQEAYAVKGKLEPGQLAKVQRKPELEQAKETHQDMGKSVLANPYCLQVVSKNQGCCTTCCNYKFAASS